MYPNIDAERARNGMSKAMLAEKLGVSYSTFKSWMTGKTDIPASKVIELSKMS
ncbi:MAG: helix-turn-helix domain-containing protein [Butyricicoccaceae bacterium]